jgi:hypothetical protein
MLDLLRVTLQDKVHLSASIYDIAACALCEGVSSANCVSWLATYYETHGEWGESFSWQDKYLCTYSAALALLVGKETSLANVALQSLDSIPDLFPDNWTSNFGGLIAALDTFAEKRLQFRIIHPLQVQAAISYDTSKWTKIIQHDQFYNATTSIAGFFAEWAYVIPDIDVARIVESFQAENGSITDSPGASAFCLLACDEVGLTGDRVDRLRDYINRINPHRQDIGTLDQAPHFVTAWSLFNLDPQTISTLPKQASIAKLRKATAPGKLVSICDGSQTFPGDMDTTACAVLALNLPPSERRDIFLAFDEMFEEHHYQTFRYERTASVTTNVHVVAAWPDNPHTPAILNWLDQQIAEANGSPTCKWHTSPYYTLSEIGRLFVDVNHPIALKLAKQAGQMLLKTQQSNGGWGWQEVTGEETCYAILALNRLRQYHFVDKHQVASALDRARQFLLQHPSDHRKLWVGKTLYYVKPLERWLRYLALTTGSNFAENQAQASLSA